MKTPPRPTRVAIIGAGPAGATTALLLARRGARVAVLDPLEGLAEGAVGDYLTVMRANLGVLRTGQGCT